MPAVFTRLKAQISISIPPKNGERKTTYTCSPWSHKLWILNAGRKQFAKNRLFFLDRASQKSERRARPRWLKFDVKGSFEVRTYRPETPQPYSEPCPSRTPGVGWGVLRFRGRVRVIPFFAHLLQIFPDGSRGPPHKVSVSYQWI